MKAMTTKALSAVGLCALLAQLAACAQKPLCPELSDCGGPVPYGDWQLAPGYGSCTEDLYVPPADTRLIKPTVPAGRDPLPEPAVFDWCDLLITSGGTEIQAQPPRFYYESGPIGSSDVRINMDGSFSASITRTGTYYLDFPAICMRQFGAGDNRIIDPIKDPTGPSGNICQQLEKPVGASGLGEGSYRNTICIPNPSDPEGCLCRFDVTETGGPGGYFHVVNHNTLEFIPQMNFPGKVTYCNKGSYLELTAADGDYLFGQKGLRTFKLKNIPLLTP